MSDDGPKIFIDEGWKAQVQREKEEAARKAALNEVPPAPAAKAADEPLPEGAADAEAEGEPTPFTALVSSLATQSMFALGLIAEPGTGQVMLNLEAARYTLDMLLMLEEKTLGNLTAEEAAMLAQASGELEEAFAVRAQQVQEQAMRQAGIDPSNLKPA